LTGKNHFHRLYYGRVRRPYLLVGKRNQKDPKEIKEFIERFRKQDEHTPIVLVPTSFNSVTEEEWKEIGANIIIYANQLMRAQVPAMQKAAEMILENHRAEECDTILMPFKDIIRLIPAEI